MSATHQTQPARLFLGKLLSCDQIRRIESVHQVVNDLRLALEQLQDFSSVADLERFIQSAQTKVKQLKKEH